VALRLAANYFIGIFASDIILRAYPLRINAAWSMPLIPEGACAERYDRNSRNLNLTAIKMSYYLAIDLGATSGRTILGTLSDGKLEQEELTRFPNSIVRQGGRCYWDIWHLYEEMLRGLRAAAARGVSLTSIGIDTWGVDFVMIGKDGQILGAPRSYRDTHTAGEPERYFAEKIPAARVYGLTGIQVMPFNSLFQFSAMRRNRSSVLEAADRILFLPDALAYMLTGKMVTEYTMASTSQMVNAATRRLEPELLESVGLTAAMFGREVMPGETIGTLTPEVQELTGLGAVPVVAVAGHDTGSAVAAVPAADKEFAYLSSGTWSLMGIEIDTPIIDSRSAAENFTHEGGVEGTIRFLKNICGMWLLERCREEWKRQGFETDYGRLVDMAEEAAPFRSLIFPDDAMFANPRSMTEAIRDYCRATAQPEPSTQGEFTRCIYESLALRYRQVFSLLKSFAPFPVRRLHVIGGGSRNDFLNRMTADAAGIEVVAGPVECTAAGNIMVQARAAGDVAGLEEMRKIIRDSNELKSFMPGDAQVWDSAYERFLAITNR